MSRKRIAVAVLMLAVIAAVGLSLRPQQTVKASGGSVGCFAPCYITPPATCQAGGTNPLPGTASKAIEQPQGTRTYFYVPPVSNCYIFVGNLAGSVVGNNPSGIEAVTFGAWESTDSSCQSVNLSVPMWTYRMGITSSTPNAIANAPTGNNLVWISNVGGVCVGFDGIASDTWQSVNAVYGYF